MEKNKIFLIWIMLPVSIFIYGQNFTFSGYIYDSNTDNPLIGVEIYFDALDKGVMTNSEGYFHIKLPKGKYRAEVSLYGYFSDTIYFDLNSNIVKTIKLKSDATVLEEVEIVSENTQNVVRIETSVNLLSSKSIKAIPPMLGEVDLIKSMQLLPGVQFVAEGSSNFSVRGGGFDQNLVLLDNAPVYSPSHLLGFFSIFNNDVIEYVKLYKGDMPLSFGGRLSSLMDIKTKNGNNKKFSGVGSIGSVSSKLTLEAPLFSEKASFFVSGRRTYADMFLKLSSDKNLKNTKLYFYDLNTKINWNINKKNRLYLSGYLGQDNFANNLAGISFSNALTSINWHHIFNARLFLDFSTYATNYNYSLKENIIEEFSFNWKSRILDIGSKVDFLFLPNDNNSLNFGYQFVFRTIHPGKGGGVGGSTIIDNSSFKIAELYSMDHALYVSHTIKLFDRLNMKYGVRFSMLNNLGNDSIAYTLDNYVVVDSFRTEKWKIYHTNFSFEPRVGINYSLSNKNSIKASYSYSSQYLQVASNTTAGSPLDIWFSASNNIKPQLCHQFVIGYFHNLFNNMLEISAESYFKYFGNVIDFKDRAVLLGNNDIERELRFGKGYSYGIELMLAKNVGNLTGWISYTFSRSFRKIDRVNDGLWYRSPFDKPHNVSLVASYDINNKWTLAASWVYTTGQPVTYPEGRYWVGDLNGNGQWVPIPSKRNAYRMPDFHRLDISATWRISNPAKRFKNELNISLYNVYARKNAWTIYFVPSEDDKNTMQAKMMYLFSIVPSISWIFSF